MKISTNLYGYNPGRVIDLLQDRVKHKSPLHTERRRKVALIVEGGGMRGVLSAGSLFGLYLLGYRGAFDNIYACSSGAVNAAYFLSDQGEAGISVYFDSLINLSFFNPLRVWKILDVDYVYDHIVSIQKKLDEVAIRACQTRLLVSTTNAQTGDSVYVDVHKSGCPVPAILKASSAMPVLYNRVVSIDGLPLVDGGISSTIPIEKAIADGCTDILVLATRPLNYRSSPPTLLGRIAFRLLIGFRYPALYAAYLNHHVRFNAERILINGQNPGNRINIALICPDEGETTVERLTLRRETLIRDAMTMAEKTFRVFDEDTSKLLSAFSRLRSGEADRIARLVSVAPTH